MRIGVIAFSFACAGMVFVSSYFYYDMNKINKKLKGENEQLRNMLADVQPPGDDLPPPYNDDALPVLELSNGADENSGIPGRIETSV